MTATTQAKYTQGNILGHLIQAAAASSVGMVAIFIVDLADMYFISVLGVPQLAAAIGFSGTLFFIAASIGMALSVASSTLVSQALGREDKPGASQYFLDVSVFAFLLGIVTTIILHFAAPVLLNLLGAKGEVHALALSYFRIVNYSLPLLLLGMTSGGDLRASGAPGLSMQSTLYGGLTNAVLDPLFIFGLWFIPGMGLEGAAIATVCSRVVVVAVSGYGSLSRQRLLSGAKVGHIPKSLGPVFAIALPSLVTSLSTPIAGAFVTSRLAAYGDEVIAGVSVFGRVLPLAFVGLFTLTMALSPVVGQNFGAKKYDRIAEALRDAAIFSFGYTIPVATVLALCAPLLASAFSLSGESAEIFTFYCRFISFSYCFFGLHLAASQTFTNTGHPGWSTYANLGRDLVILLPVVLIVSDMGARAVLIGQYSATVASGLVAFAVAIWLVRGLESKGKTVEDIQQVKFHRPVTQHSPVRGH